MRLRELLGFVQTHQEKTTTETLQQGGGVCEADSAPERSLGLQPVIESEEDLVLGLQWLSWGKSRNATVQAYTEQIIRLARDAAAQDLQLTVEDQQVALEKHLKAIEAEVIRYADEHRDELFAKRKTAKFSAGELTLKDTPVALIYEPDKETVLEELLGSHDEAECTIIDSCRKVLAPWLKLTLSLDVEGIKRAFNNGEIDAEDLEGRGMKMEAGESLKANPYDYSQRQVA